MSDIRVNDCIIGPDGNIYQVSLVDVGHVRMKGLSGVEWSKNDVTVIDPIKEIATLKAERDEAVRHGKEWEHVYNRDIKRIRDEREGHKARVQELERELGITQSELSAAKTMEHIADHYLKALEEIAKGEGPYSMDPLTHAGNTIEAMKRIATEVIKKGVNDE